MCSSDLAAATPASGEQRSANSPALRAGLPNRLDPSAGSETLGSATEPAADPEDWSSELAGLELQLRRLGWSRDEEASYLQRAFGHPSRSRLTTYADLRAYLGALEGLASGADPCRAPVPLRRRDLLTLSDQLLAELGWTGEQARPFLERHLGASSRQQLSDSQLLQFNMLLENELLAAEPGDGRMPAESAAAP